MCGKTKTFVAFWLTVALTGLVSLLMASVPASADYVQLSPITAQNGSINVTGDGTFGGALNVQGSNGLTLGVAGVTPGQLSLANAANSQLTILQAAAPIGAGNATILLPSVMGGSTATVCLQNSAACGFESTSGNDFIQNGTAQQAANFNISGTGIAGNLQTSNLDTPSATALNIGTTNATVINLDENTTVAADKTLAITSLASCDRLTSDPTGTLGCSDSADLHVNKLSVYGDSYAAGGTIATPTNYNTGRFSSRLASLLHAQEYNKAVNGTAASGGGWITVLQDEKRTRTSAPYVAAPGDYLVNFGVNDLKYLGPSNYGPFQQALRTIIARSRASAVFEDTDPSISYSSSWNTKSDTTKNSGSTYHCTAANGSTVTISVPSDFPGGTIDVGLMATSNGNGALHTFTEGNTVLGSLDTHNLQSNNSGNNGYLGVVKRLTLSPGAHTITDTISNLTGTTYFDYWQIEAPQPPLVIVPLAPRLLSYSSFTPYTPNDNDIANLNAAKASVVSEFDSSVITVNFDAVMNKDATNFTSDNVHPNDQGNAKLAAALYKAITAAPVTVDQSAYAAPLQAVTYDDYATFQNNDDTTTGFQVQNAAGSTVFDVDTADQRVGIGTTTPEATLSVASTATTGLHGILNAQYSDNAGGAFLIGRKARGTPTAPMAVQNGDSLFVIFPQAYDGSTYQNPTSIAFKADGTVSNGNVPTDIVFSTGANGVGLPRLTISSVGTVTFNAHLISGNINGTTKVAAGSALGTSPTVKITGDDTAGTITITAGSSGMAAGTLATITFANAYGSTPAVVLTPANAAAVGLGYYYNATTSNFTLNSVNTAAAATTYSFSYHIIQ